MTVGVLENYNANRGAVVKTVINKGESFINFGNVWEDFSTIKQQTELGFYTVKQKRRFIVVLLFCLMLISKNTAPTVLTSGGE